MTHEKVKHLWSAIVGVGIGVAFAIAVGGHFDIDSESDPDSDPEASSRPFYFRTVTNGTDISDIFGNNLNLDPDR